MLAIEQEVNKVLKQWNQDVLEAGIKKEYILDVKVRKKTLYLNKEKTFEEPIAEMKLITKGLDNSEPTILLWRKELQYPEKVQGASKNEIVEEYKRRLYFYFLYEALGNFCTVTEQLIKNQDYAEYDIEKDRLKAHESGDGMVIQAMSDGTFFKNGDKFDVFMETDDFFFVYTAHASASQNNGINKIPVKEAIILENKKVRIITNF